MRADDKLLVPGVQPGTIERTQLIERLQRSTVPQILVTAPPGYGKTTALAQWVRADPRPIAWLSLDAEDEDAVVLFRNMVLALDSALQLGSERLKALTAGPPELSTVALPRLGRYLIELDRPMVLVLDDIPAEPAPLVRDVIREVAAHLPPGAQLVLASRGGFSAQARVLPPDFGILRIGAAELAMSELEGGQLLRRAGLRLTSEQVAEVVRRTEGWPIALYLTVLLLRERSDVAQTVERLVDRRGPLIEFLETALLSGTPAATVRFLTRTAILRTPTGAACDYLLQTSDSAELLDQLSAANMLLFPMDRQRGLYRYHQLFAQMLRARLYQSEPDLAVELHGRASDWFLRQDDLEGAVEHAQAAHDVERAEAIVWAGVQKLLPVGRRTTVERWLAGFPAEEVARRPRLALATAWCAVQAGQPVDPWINQAEHEAALIPDQRQPSTLQSDIALLRAGVARRGTRQMCADAEFAYRASDPDSPFRTVACLLAGAAHDLLGDRERAKVWLEEGVRIGVVQNVPSLHAQCLAQLAVIALAEGDRAALERHASDAMNEVTRYNLADSAAPIVTVFIVMAMAAAYRQEWAAAREYARQSRRMLARLTNVMPWLAVQAPTILAQAHLLIGEVATAHALAEEARQELRRFPDAVSLQERLDEVWQLTEAEMDAADGSSVLTSAELRVLQYLPSHLDFDEIGERLGVPRPLIQRRAVAIYRKLGVVSRRDAVERALVLGLMSAEEPSGMQPN